MLVAIGRREDLRRAQTLGRRRYGGIANMGVGVEQAGKHHSLGEDWTGGWSHLC
jgi:hypothetical protein